MWSPSTDLPTGCRAGDASTKIEAFAVGIGYATCMKHGPDIAPIAALMGDPARANMLTELLDGRALTATELAQVAGVTAQTASSHLAKLTEGGLVQDRKQGRHKYFALADDEVAAVLEALLGLAAGTGATRLRPGPKDDRLREARVCYNHLAGRMGVQMFQSLSARGLILVNGERVELSDPGRAFAQEFGIDLRALEASRSPLCRSCLDWSERRSHLAGSLGRALLARMEDLRWARRDKEGRAVDFSPAGRQGFARLFKA